MTTDHHFSLVTPQPLALNGLTNKQYDQWPILDPKLSVLKDLVKEQLSLSHFEPSHSRFNTPIFIIRKKSGNHHILQDLRQIKVQMEKMAFPHPRQACHIRV